MKKTCFLCVAFLLFNAFALNASSYSWTGGAGTSDWQTNANWSPSTGYPVDGDNVTISITGSPISISVPSTVTSLVNFSVNNLTVLLVADLTLTGNVSMTGCVFSNGGTGDLIVENSGTVSMSSCTLDINFELSNLSVNLVALSQSTFNNSLEITVNNFSLVSDHFYGISSILKKGTMPVFAAACHDNHFHEKLHVSHEEAGVFFFANNNDVFDKRTVFENKSGASVFYVGSSSSYSATTFFHGDVEFINNSSEVLSISNPATSHVEFSSASGEDSITIRCKSGSTGYLYVGNAGGIDFIRSKVYLSSTFVYSSSSPYQGSIQVGAGLASPTANRVVFDPNSDLHTDSMNVAFTMTGAIFQGQYTEGVLDTPDTLRFLGDHFFTFTINEYCRFDRDLKIDVLAESSGKLYGTYNGKVVYIERSNIPIGGTTPDAMVFNNDVTFIYKNPSSGGGWGIMGNPLTNGQRYASFNSHPSRRSIVTIRSESASMIWFGYLQGIIEFNSVDVVIERASTGMIHFGYQSDIRLTDVNLYLKQSSASNSLIVGTSTTVTFDGVTIDASEVTGGNVTFNKLLCKENFFWESISGSGNSSYVLINPDCIFEKNVYLKSPNFRIAGGWFKGNTEFYKYETSGTLDIINSGGGTFDGDFTLTNESSHFFIFGNISTDVYNFNGNVTLKRLSTGEIRLARIGSCYFKGNLDYQGNFATYPYGDAGGKCIFNGTTDQIISHSSSSSYPFIVTKIDVNKSSGQLILANPIKVIKYGSTAGILNLVKGNIATSPTGLLTMGDDATISGGGKHSFIEGPCSKQGDDAFTFPIGKPSRYYPVSMTTPSNNSGAFTAEFFYDDIPVSSSKSAPLQDLMDCQYWNISTTGSATSSMTFCWHNESGQNCKPVDANTITVARFNGTSWVDEGANNLVSSPGDSGTVRSNTQTTFGYYTLGATLANTITPNDVYAVLKRKMDGGYYNVIDENLYFKFEHEYSVSESSTLSYTIFDEQHAPVTMSSAVVKYGDNRYAWNVEALTAGKYYLLEVRNVKGEKWVLLFKV